MSGTNEKRHALVTKLNERNIGADIHEALGITCVVVWGAQNAKTIETDMRRIGYKNVRHGQVQGQFGSYVTTGRAA